MGNFELVTPLAEGGLGHYCPANNMVGSPWLGPAIFGKTLGKIDAVSLIQSTFSIESYGVGNLELISQGRGQLFHFWLDNPSDPLNESYPWSWYGPWVVTR